MGFTHHVWAWEQEGLTYAEKFTLLALADYAPEVGNPNAGKCWASIPNLAVKMGFSSGSRRTVREALKGLEEKGRVRVQGRLRPGTKQQTTHLYTLLMPKGYVIREKDDTAEVGAISTDVGAISTEGRGYQPHEYTNEPTNEPTTTPTPSPLRDDEEKNPYAIEASSTASEGSPGETEEHTTELRKLLHGLIDSTEYEYPVLADEFIARFEEIHGAGNGINDAGDLFWNKRYEERLHDEVRAARAEKGQERGLQYAAAKWLSTFTNHVNS